MARSRFLGVGAVVASLVVLAVLTFTVNGSFAVMIGVLVVGAGFFLPPRAALLVVGIAGTTALLLLLLGNIEYPWLRLANITIASALAMLASVTRARRLRTIEDLRQAEAAVLASSPDPIVVIAPDGTLMRANPATAGLVPHAVVGQPFHEALGHVLADGSPCPGDCVLAGVPIDGRTEVTGEWLTLDGRRVPIEASAGPLRGAGGTVVNLRDVSARLEAEEDRRVLLAAARQREGALRLAAVAQHSPLPVVEGLGFDLGNRPAAGGRASGSDVSDISILPDGRVLLLLVDSLGEGPVPESDAWKVLYVARAFLNAGVPLEDVVRRSAITLAAETPPPVASVLAAVLDRTSGRITVAAGGHPPPLLVHSSGSSDWLRAIGGGLGDAEPGSSRMATAVLLPGDRLLLFTDGVVDGQRDIVEGLSLLSSAASARRSLPLHGWADGLLRVIFGDQPAQDDATILVVERLADSGH